MPVIKIWGIPNDYPSEKAENIISVLQSAIIGIRELGLTDRNQVSVFLPKDHVSKDLGQEIIVSVENLLQKPERTPQVIEVVRMMVCSVLRISFQTALIECTATVLKEEDITVLPAKTVEPQPNCKPCVICGTNTKPHEDRRGTVCPNCGDERMYTGY